MISWQNVTSFLETWIGYVVINNTDINLSDINPIGDRYQLTYLPARSIRYSRLMQYILMKGLNMTANGPFLSYQFLKLTLSSEAELLCQRHDGQNNISQHIIGVNCWTLLGFPMHTTRGIEQTFYSCASIIEAGVKTIKLQSSTTGEINVTDVQTIPAQWYIENGGLGIIIADMNPWWGGVEFGEKLPNNSLLVSENTLLLPVGASNVFSSSDANAASAPGNAINTMIGLYDMLAGYQADENGLTEEGISGMYQRQCNDIMINMVTPTNQAKIVSTAQFTIDKTCYDLFFAAQYFVAMIGLIMIFCILLASLMNVGSFNALTKIGHVVRKMDLGRAILNAQGYGESSTVGSSKWVK
nr:12431_t:CDS:2 [Entrophospora candida]